MDGKSRRIIGDFLEINADIVREETESKYPRFISHFIAKRHRKRLLRLLDKFYKNKSILNTDTLSEYFIYCFNDYPPKGSHKSVFRSHVKELGYHREIEAVIKFETIYCIISIPGDSDGFDITVRDKDPETGNTNSCTIHSDRLTSKNSKTKSLLEKVNEQLIEDIYYFIKEKIENYLYSITEVKINEE